MPSELRSALARVGLIRTTYSPTFGHAEHIEVSDAPAIARVVVEQRLAELMQQQAAPFASLLFKLHDAGSYAEAAAILTAALFTPAAPEKP